MIIGKLIKFDIFEFLRTDINFRFVNCLREEEQITTNCRTMGASILGVLGGESLDNWEESLAEDIND